MWNVFPRPTRTRNPLTCLGVSTWFAAATLPVLTLLPVNTETYHAQYHVLEAFSFFNMILSEWQNSINASADPDKLSPQSFCVLRVIVDSRPAPEADGN